MRYGVCIDIARIKECEALGYDYAEGKLNGIAALSESEFSERLELVKSSLIGVEACSLLFPKTMDLGSVTETELTDYLALAFSRMEKLGASVAVFGSGKSRRIKENERWQEAFVRLVKQARLVCSVAEAYGVMVAVEALHRGETNFINSLAEGAALQAAVNRKNFSIIADLYHVNKENEPLERIALVSPLAHTHIAVQDGRGYPVEPSEEVRLFFQALKDAGYDGRMSIEGSTKDFQGDSVKALRTLRQLEGEIYG